MSDARRLSARGKCLRSLSVPRVSRPPPLPIPHSPLLHAPPPKFTVAAGSLTIDTEALQPVIVPSVSPAAAPSPGPNGTPRSWFGTTSGLADPRSWLQSPRKWANNRTPTNQGGDATPNTKKVAAYFNTLQKPKGKELMGKQEEEDKPKSGTSSTSRTTMTTTTTTTPAAPVPTSLANLMHQTDKDGKSQHVALPSSPLHQEQHEEDDEPAPAGSSFLGRLMRSLHLSDDAAAPSTTITTTSTTSSSSPSRKTGDQLPKPLTPPPSSSSSSISRKENDLLGEVHPDDVGKKCLILDLDETLVHSSFQPVEDVDFVIPIVIEGTQHQVYVLKRPGVDEFMQRVAKDYEIVIFTASLALYADPLLDQLDIHNVVRHRLYRESCSFFQGSYVKDLTRLGREVSQCILVDNSPLSYMFQPENAIGCSSYIDATMDGELDVIAAFLEDVRGCGDVREHCRSWRQWGIYGSKGLALAGKRRGVVAG